MTKTLIFDWSGTLSNNIDCFCKVCDLIFEKFGIEKISKEEIQINFDIPYMKFWNKYLPDLSKEEQDILYDKFMTSIPKPDLYQGAKETILELHKQGFDMFILSSDRVTTLLPELEKSGIKDFFKEVLTRNHEKVLGLNKLIKKYNLEKNNTYYIGDTSGDIKAGKEAKIKTIGVSWGFQHKSILSESKPDFLIDNIIELNILFLKK